MGPVLQPLLHGVRSSSCKELAPHTPKSFLPLCLAPAVTSAENTLSGFLFIQAVLGGVV